MIEKLEIAIKGACDTLNTIQKRKHAGDVIVDFIHYKEGRKFVNINVGGSGAWMVEKETGEIFNIKGYGVPDRNKKLKANIGNIYSVDFEAMHAKRWQYLR